MRIASSQQTRELEKFADEYLRSYGFRPDGSDRSQKRGEAPRCLFISIPAGQQTGWRLKKKRR